MGTKGINLTVSDFEKKMIQVINESGLPVCVIRMVITKLLGQVKEIEEKTLEDELRAYRSSTEGEGA